MQCVYTGYLPNFFIPENNMFAGKVVGAQQVSLYKKLETFYQMGVAFLFHSPTVRKILFPALSNPYFVIQTEECYLKSESEIDIAVFGESDSEEIGMMGLDLMTNMWYLKVIDQLFSAHHNVVYHLSLLHVLRITSMSLKAQCLSVSQKKRYVFDRAIIQFTS
jgi:hypothetical protein